MKKPGVAPVEVPVSKPKLSAIDTVALPESVGGALNCRPVPALSEARFSTGLIGVLVWKLLSANKYSPSANWPSTVPASAGSARSAAARPSNVDVLPAAAK